MKKLLLAIVLACLAGATPRVCAQDSVPTNHTVVRFEIFTGGTNFGSIDLELFDQEKPETVKNFLLYVYSGGYSNLVLHRLERNFVLQAGHVTIPDPDSDANFNSYVSGPDFGGIVDEFNTGPRLSNMFATIAMARVSGETNSARTDWFINLKDNLFLDTQEGGYTVFGRVIDSLDERSGTNLLGYFNHVTNRLGATGIPGPLEVFTSLPVSTFRYQYTTNESGVVTTNTFYIRRDDLFVVRASIIQGGQARDNTPPSVTIESPAEGATVSGNTVTFSGSASDNQAVARVIYDTEFGRVIASGTDHWTATIDIVSGTNRIVVRSVDYFGNFSAPAERVVFRSPFQPIRLEMIGKGKISGITNGQILEVGQDYTMTATPARGYYFNGWRGDGYANDRTVVFTMQDNLRLVARFSKTLLGLATGTYQGVFFPSTNGPPNSAGLLSLNLRGNGLYSGKIKPIGATYYVRGKLNEQGHDVEGGYTGSRQLFFQVDLAQEGSEALTGYYSDGTFLSSFVLFRVQPFGGTNAPAPAGDYSFNLSPPADPNSGVTNSGSGTVSIDAKGHVRVEGTLADGVVIKEKTKLLKGNLWPFYFTQRKNDSVLGMVTFETNQTFRADVKWFAPNFPGGTNQNVTLEVSP